MRQADLFEPTEADRLCRHADPETSRAGAESAVATLGERQRWAAECVVQRPGLTVSELAAHFCPTDPRRIGRRLNECEKLGMVVRGTPRVCSKSGRPAATWHPPKRTT